MNTEEILLIVEDILKGDIKKFEDLIDQYKNLVFSVINSKIPNWLSYLKDDIAQEVFLRVYDNLKYYDKNKSFINWIFTITLNVIKDFVKKEKRERKKYIFTERVIKFEPLFSDEIEIIKGVINTLPEKYQKILFLYYSEDKTIKEISEILSVNENTIKVWLFRARNRIEKKLKKLKPK